MLKCWKFSSLKICRDATFIRWRRRNGFHALLKLEEPKYTIEQIGAKVGKAPAYVASRARLTELIPAVVEAFYAEEIGVGHALLLAKLQPAQREAGPRKLLS